MLGPSLFWLMAMPAHAARVSEPMLNASEPQYCVMSAHSRFNLVCERASKLRQAPRMAPVDWAKNPQEHPTEFAFTTEESNAALALFGCDCPLCINSLRTLRTMAAMG